VFYNIPELYSTLNMFFEKTFNKEAGIPQADAKKGAKKVAEIVEKTMNFKGDFA
jgi:hypothetical protein